MKVIITPRVHVQIPCVKSIIPSLLFKLCWWFVVLCVVKCYSYEYVFWESCILGFFLHVTNGMCVLGTTLFIFILDIIYISSNFIISKIYLH